MELFEWLTKDNVTFVLSIISFIGTASGWGYFWLTTHKKLSMKISDYNWNSKGLLVYFQITNHSRIPIAINDVSVIIDQHEFHCAEIPTKVLETTRHIGKEVISRNEFFSVAFPLNLSALCGAHGYLYFRFEPEMFQPAPSKAYFVVRTNRGKAWKTLLPLEKVLH